jgi:LacI family transcriptional regulator
MVSIKDIARQAGMSPSTVSRVANGKKHVNPVKRQRILQLIEETGYVPNKAARTMVLKKTSSVGLVMPDTFNIFQRELFSIIERSLESFGYYTMFFFSKFEDLSEENCLNKVKAENLDGIIMLHEMRNPAFYEYLNRAGIPAITATFRFPGIPAIHVNEEQAAADAVNHLVSLGHRDIVMISGDGFTFGRQRAEGFFQALAGADIDREANRVVCVRNYTAEFGMYGMRELLLRRGGRQGFSAVFAATDELAIGAIRALEDAGMRVPEDVSVMGFDDVDISDYVIPRLTTVRQPIKEMGEQTALALHRSITGKGTVQEDQTLPYRLIIRESTGAFRPASLSAGKSSCRGGEPRREKSSGM